MNYSCIFKEKIIAIAALTILAIFAAFTLPDAKEVFIQVITAIAALISLDRIGKSEKGD